MILHNLYTTLTLLCLNSCLLAAPVECQENAYMMQAPQEIAERVQQVARRMGFTQPYELVVPKKAGIEINPWNRYITYCINPQTQRFFILVNPEWINQLDQNEQDFLFARCFGTFQEQGGMLSTGTKAIPYVHMVLSFLLIIGSYVAISKTQTIANRWLAAAVAYGGVLLLNLTLLNGLQSKLVSYMSLHHDVVVQNKVIERIGNKDAAFSALMHFDEAIKKEVAQGDPFLKPFVNTFQMRAQELQRAQ